MAFLIVGLITGPVYLVSIWRWTRDLADARSVRFLAIGALVGSIVLFIAAALNGLCGIAENRSELFYERCEGSVPYIPLYAIPLLLAAPFLRRFVPGALIWGAGAVVVFVGIVVPLQLLSV
jgi:hypothetical protein